MTSYAPMTVSHVGSCGAEGICTFLHRPPPNVSVTLVPAQRSSVPRSPRNKEASLKGRIDDQPLAVRVDVVANGPKNVGIRPAIQSTGGCQVGGYKRPYRHGKVLADIEATGERAAL